MARRAQDRVLRTSSILNTQPVRRISLRHLSRYVSASLCLPLAVMQRPRAAAVSMSPT